MSPRSRTIAELAADVERLGARPGDVLMVHASVRAIGPVDGGADGLLDALQTVLGRHGTMLMTLGARDDWSWVNDRPESERPALLHDAEPFDAARTPADPEVGVLAEVFRTRPGTIVSDHPEGRFAASGQLAELLTRDVPWNDYYGPGSPLARFVEREGRVLRLGADLDTVTVLHYAEHLVPLAGKRRVRRYRRVVAGPGARIRVVESLDDSNGIVDHPGEDYFATILRTYLATGRAQQGRVGDAPAELIEARDLVEFGVAWMATNLRSSAV